MLHPMLADILARAGVDPASASVRGNVVRCGGAGGAAYFARVARGGDVAQMRGEAASLRAMAATAPKGLVPRVLGFEEKDNQAAMVSEYLDRGGGGKDQAKLGRDIAAMHNPPPADAADPATTEYTGKYGFPVPTHCGATEQDNTWEESWEVFFRDRRLGDLVRRLGDRRVDKAWDRCLERAVPLLLGDITPSPKPVPLHGDLWPGNVAGGGIFDPSSYYGHNEADLGMTRMFGGFSNEFYNAYHQVHPRSSPHYEQRQQLYELYHHLNHALLFGGGYTSGALRIMDGLSDWAAKQA